MKREVVAQNGRKGRKRREKGRQREGGKGGGERMEEEDGLKKDERVEISKDMEEENIVMCIASFNIHGLITTSVHYENVGGHREKLLFSNYYNFCIPTASQDRMVPLIKNLTIYFKRGSSVKKKGVKQKHLYVLNKSALSQVYLGSPIKSHISQSISNPKVRVNFDSKMRVNFGVAQRFIQAILSTDVSKVFQCFSKNNYFFSKIFQQFLKIFQFFFQNIQFFSQKIQYFYFKFYFIKIPIFGKIYFQAAKSEEFLVLRKYSTFEPTF